MNAGATGERLVALFILGVVCLSPPLMLIFDSQTRVFGVPLLYLYLFGIWAILIILLACATELARPDERPNGNGDRLPPDNER